MVLRPSAASAPSRGAVAAWDAVLPTQQRDRGDGWLITQPDHAALAGDIAERLSPSLFPGIDAAVLRGIALHDEGWAKFDQAALASAAAARSFIDEYPPTFVDAWTGSIERAAEIAPIAGIIVSKHFWRLASMRELANDSSEDRSLISGFISTEQRRQQQLAGECQRYDIEFLTDVLQFCDVLSLYLCCGASDDVNFPQDFGGFKVGLHRVRTKDEGEICRFSPRIFDGGVNLAISGRHAGRDRVARQFLFVLE